MTDWWDLYLRGLILCCIAAAVGLVAHGTFYEVWAWPWTLGFGVLVGPALFLAARDVIRG